MLQNNFWGKKVDTKMNSFGQKIKGRKNVGPKTLRVSKNFGYKILCPKLILIKRKWSPNFFLSRQVSFVNGSEEQISKNNRPKRLQC